MRKCSPVSLLFTMVLLCCNLLFLTGPATAEDKVLRVGAPDEGWPPFIMPVKEVGYRGIMGDVLTTIAEKVGYTVEFHTLPEKRLQLYLTDGTIDAYPKALEWVEDPSLYRWTEPVLNVEDMVIIRKLSPKASVPATLLGLNLGVIHGYSYPKLNELFADGSIRRHDAKTLDNLLCMLDHGHVDAIIANPIVTNWTIKNNDPLKGASFLCSTKPLDSAPYRFAFTKAWDSSRLVEFINDELATMKKDGRLEAILNKYR